MDFDELLEIDGLAITNYRHTQPTNSSDADVINDLIVAEQHKHWLTRATSKPLARTRCVNLFVSRRKDKERVVYDHTFPPSNNTNQYINTPTTGFLDQLSDLLLHIHAATKQLNPKELLVGWKADIANAHRLIPLHPLASLKCAIRYGCPTLYDRRLSFGLRNANVLFAYLAGLLSWVMRYKLHIRPVLVFVDDFFGIDAQPASSNSPPPALKQVTQLIDYLSIPCKPQKCQFGQQLQILGINCDFQSLTIFLTTTQLNEILHACEPSKLSAATARQLAGWLNWVASVAPLIRPFTSALYRLNSPSAIPLPAHIRSDLQNIRLILSHSYTRPMLRDYNWRDSDCDVTIYTDASSGYRGHDGIGITLHKGHKLTS